MIRHESLQNDPSGHHSKGEIVIHSNAERHVDNTALSGNPGLREPAPLKLDVAEAAGADLGEPEAPEVVDVEVGRCIEEVDDVAVPAYLTASESSANPTEGGSNR